MSSRRRPYVPPVNVRLVAEGTRVVVLKDAAPRVAGVIRDVRTEPYLKSYVVSCDDGTIVYASGHDLAREDDGGITPLGPRPEE
jgi:hypothetical protein